MKTGIYAKLKWLRRGKTVQDSPCIPASSSPVPPGAGWLLPQCAQILLDTPLRQRLMSVLWQRTSLCADLFAELYQTPVAHFAELVQQFPASEYHHHAFPGGLLDHTLEVMAFAAKLRQRHLLPAGMATEDQAREAEAWTAGIIYAALLHDAGKIATDIQVTTADNQRWYPWHGPLTQPYRLKYRKNRNYELHPAAAALFTVQILPATALDWLAQYPELYEAFLLCVSGHYDRAGIIGELVQEADRASVAQFMGADASRAVRQTQAPLAKHLLTALRELVQTQFTLNNPHGGSDGWLTATDLWLISKTSADRIRAWLLQQGVTSVPDSNIRLFDEMQAYGLLAATPQGKAVWSCEISAATGWTPGRPLTLLRIPPARIWSTAEDRPAVFAGQISPLTVSGKPPEPCADIKKQTHTAPSADSETALTDLTFSLFAPEENAAGQITAAAEDDLMLIPPPQPESGTAPEKSCQEKTPAAPEARLPVPPDTAFTDWLKAGICSRRIAVNDARAPVHQVEGKAFLVSPEIFKLYVKTTTGSTGDEWKQVQKRFQKLKLHLRGDEGINIFTCEVKGPRKTRRVRGYLLENPQMIFGSAEVEDNPYLSVVMQ